METSNLQNIAAIMQDFHISLPILNVTNINSNPKLNHSYNKVKNLDLIVNQSCENFSAPGQRITSQFNPRATNLLLSILFEN
jgi:hypothetical protein